VASDAPHLLRRGLQLEYITLGWNIVGTVVVLIAAVFASSVALAGFGLDSLIEILASVMVVWELKGIEANREQIALRVIGISFLVLAVYILAQSISTLSTVSRPDTSLAGICWTALTLGVMLALALGKARTGNALGNQVLMTEGRVTLVDAYLAGAVLLGLVLNLMFAWWWADPVAGLVIVFYGVKEGITALRGASELAKTRSREPVHRA
jgi:divalent metal cation (Fe/Co/Zn/Cd) transporter